MTALGLRAAALLAPMVEIRTHHPSAGDPGGNERALCDHLAPLLDARGADEIVIADVSRGHGGPGAYIWARWGTPTWILNVHIDTVPANRGWTRDPWTATIDGDRLWGLGSADTKGAIACALAAMDVAPPRDAGVSDGASDSSATRTAPTPSRAPPR